MAIEDGSDLTVQAIDLEGGSPVERTLLPSYVGSYEVRLTAFLYRRSLFDLAVEEGVLTEASAEPSRSIPAATSTRTLTLRGEDFGEWIDGDPSPEVAAFRIPGVSVAECVDGGGCFGEDSFACRSPCPENGAVDPPLPPAPPAMTCAPGWSPVVVRGAVSACDPWPEGAPSCSGAEAIFPGDASCRELGAPCPAGDWPSQVPSGPAIYVLAGANGDGSQASPLGSIQSAIDRAASGDVVVIGAGSYAESVRISKAVTLYGACPARTSIGGVVVASNATVQHLTIAGAKISFEADSSLMLREAIVEGSPGRAIEMMVGARAELRDVSIRGARDFAIWLDGDFGARAMLVGSRVEISGCGGGITARNADLMFEDVIVRGSLPRTSREFGRGAVLREGVTASFDRSVLDDNYDIGMFMLGAVVDLDRVLVRGTKSHPNELRFGHGLEAQGAARVTLKNSWLDGNQAQNIYVLDPDTEMTIEDTVLSRARAPDEGTSGYDLAAVHNAHAVVRRTSTLEAANTSFLIQDHALVELEDVAVLAPAIDAIQVDDSSDLIATRVRADAPGRSALTMYGGRASVTDLHAVAPGAADCYTCSGICINEAAIVDDALRIAIEDASGSAVLAFNEGTLFAASHLAITGTRFHADCRREPFPVLLGRGTALFALEGGRVVADQFLLAESFGSGAQISDLRVDQRGTSLDLSHGAIRDNGVGATLSLAGYDPRRVSTWVVYSGNQVNLERTEGSE